MRIKRHKNDNDYALAGGVWVRDFTKAGVRPVDVNDLVSPSDFPLLVGNETANRVLRLQQVDAEDFRFRDVVVVSVGFGLMEKHRILAKLPNHVAIFATNGALSRWELVGPRCPEGEKRRVNFYVANNPYRECLSFLPRQTRYYPSCVVSARTDPEFVRVYHGRGTVLQYTPTPSRSFQGLNGGEGYTVDDYRNPVCAAVGLAYRFGVERVVLFCCDESFADDRPGSVAAGNGLYEYPHHAVARRVIDANLHWLTSQADGAVEARHCSGAGEYENATYISPDEIANFFN